MKWKESLSRALQEMKAEEARLSQELTDLRARISALSGVGGGTAAGGRGGKRTMSAAGRAAIARAAKKRWAKWRAEKRKDS